VLFGKAGADILSAAVVICVVGSVAALVMVCPRVYYAMARDGVFLHVVAQLHPRFGTLVRAIGIQGMLTALLVAIGAFDQIIASFIFVAVLFLGLTVSTLFVFRRRDASLGSAPTVRAMGYPLTPLAFLALIVLLLALTFFHSPQQVLLGCGVVLLGLPVYALLQHKQIVPQDADRGTSEGANE
jgi:APA family basic amino acid/polyamine antiporter